MPPVRRTASLVFRVAVVSLLCLVLASPTVQLRADQLAVAVLLDRSDSISPAARDEQEQWLAKALAAKGANDQVAVITFGEDATVERALSGRPRATAPGARDRRQPHRHRRRHPRRRRRAAAERGPPPGAAVRRPRKPGPRRAGRGARRGRARAADGRPVGRRSAARSRWSRQLDAPQPAARRRTLHRHRPDRLDDQHDGHRAPADGRPAADQPGASTSSQGTNRFVAARSTRSHRATTCCACRSKPMPTPLPRTTRPARWSWSPARRRVLIVEGSPGECAVPGRRAAQPPA